MTRSPSIVGIYCVLLANSVGDLIYRRQPTWGALGCGLRIVLQDADGEFHMNRSLVAAAALVAGIAIASPMLAWSADNPPQAAPDQSGAGGMRGMMGGMPGMMGGMHHPGWMREMMMRRMMSPRQRCEERLARRAGMVAYTIAKLDLTAQQRPQWDKLQGLLQAGADKERQLCTSLKPAGERGTDTVLDRLNRREQFLSARLQTIQQVRPALEQFYQALTPEQKAIIDHPFRHWRD
jgi:hypothetical protein